MPELTRVPLSPPLEDPVGWRVAEALIDAVDELGYHGVSAAEVAARAGIGREQFDLRYDDMEDCVLRVVETVIADFAGGVAAAYEAGETWREGVRAAAYAAALWIDEHPRATRFGMLDILEAKGEMVRVRREELFDFCAEILDAGRAQAAHPAAIPGSVPTFMIGSVAEMLTRRLRTGRSAEAVERVPELMFLALRPYVGEEEAREELRLPPPVR